MAEKESFPLTLSMFVHYIDNKERYKKSYPSILKQKFFTKTKVIIVAIKVVIVTGLRHDNSRKPATTTTTTKKDVHCFVVNQYL